MLNPLNHAAGKRLELRRNLGGIASTALDSLVAGLVAGALLRGNMRQGLTLACTAFPAYFLVGRVAGNYTATTGFDSLNKLCTQQKFDHTQALKQTCKTAAVELLSPLVVPVVTVRVVCGSLRLWPLATLLASGYCIGPQVRSRVLDAAISKLTRRTIDCWLLGCPEWHQHGKPHPELEIDFEKLKKITSTSSKNSQLNKAVFQVKRQAWTSIVDSLWYNKFVPIAAALDKSAAALLGVQETVKAAPVNKYFLLTAQAAAEYSGVNSMLIDQFKSAVTVARLLEKCQQNDLIDAGIVRKVSAA